MVDKENSRFNIELWKKIGVFMLILFMIDVFLALYARIRYGDLLFIEGAVILAIGAYVASGVANLRRESYATLAGSPEGHKEYLEEQRSKQVSDGVLIMVIGAIVIAVSILYFLV